MTTATLRELPVDAWPAITRCLTGADLFRLACVSRWSWQSFSQDDCWRDRLTLEDAHAAGGEEGAGVTALQQYMRAFSFQFHGLVRGPQENPSRGVCAEVAAFANEVIRSQHQPFAFDVWFCLRGGASSDDTNKSTKYVGGVVFGAQSIEYEDPSWAYYHQQYIVVSSDRKLFCSVMNEKPEIATDLELNRWYHLALTFSEGTQQVYLDGRLVSALVDRLHYEWGYASHVQVGTGCITAGDGQFPEPDCCGWFPFNGLIDDFRFWLRELTADDVRNLARGNVERMAWRPIYSLKRDLRFFSPQRPGKVGCSRPKELLAEPLYRRRERAPA